MLSHSVGNDLTIIRFGILQTYNSATFKFSFVRRRTSSLPVNYVLQTRPC